MEVVFSSEVKFYFWEKVSVILVCMEKDIYKNVFMNSFS